MSYKYLPYICAFYSMHFFIIGRRMNYFLIIAFMMFLLSLFKIERLSCFIQSKTIYQLSANSAWAENEISSKILKHFGKNVSDDFFVLTLSLNLQRSFTWALLSLNLPYEEIQQNLVYGFVKMFAEREVWSEPF